MTAYNKSSFLHTIRNLLFQEKTHTVLEEDHLIEYVYSLITTSPPRILSEKYKSYKMLPEKDRRTAFLSPYFMIEEFIVKHKPPEVRNDFTLETLRADIGKNITIQNLRPEGRLIFAPAVEQRLYLYELCISQIADYMLQSIGLPRVSQVILNESKTTIFEKAVINRQGINFDTVDVHTLTLQQLIDQCKQVYSLLFEEVYIKLGETNALSIVRNTFEYLKKNYDYTITSYFFEILPEGIFTNERVSFMNRDTLEKQIIERTSQLEETKLHLEEKVARRTIELEQQKQRIETILTSIGDAVFAVDLNCQIILMNNIAEDLSGFTFAEAQGKYYSQIFRFVLEDSPTVPYAPFVEKVIKTGIKQELSTHTLIVRRNGQKISISDSAAPIKDRDGNIHGCVIVFRDATKERELEQAKDTFVSIAAHQLRTPLGSIRWNIEMILDGDMGELSPDLKEALGYVYENDKRLITLVNDLLNVSRIDQKRIPYEPAVVNIIEVIHDTIRELEADASKKNMQIKFDALQKDTINLTLDKKRFREVIENLTSNAVKYSIPHSEVVIKVIPVEDSIQISVTDSGIGIPEKDKANIFSKFFRAQNALKSETEGTGLGLFVVKSFVENLGGSVWFESIENKGTTFFIKLPAK